MNWLKELREKQNLTQKQLEEKSGVSLFTIQNIEQGTRKGSETTINKLLKFFKKETEISSDDMTSLLEYFKEQNNIIYSFDSEELIEELKKDIEEFGENKVLYAMFKKMKDCIFLVNYDFITEEASLTEAEKKTFDLILELKAKDILKILELQNKVE